LERTTIVWPEQPYRFPAAPLSQWRHQVLSVL
jgi:hypothetical protein